MLPTPFWKKAVVMDLTCYFVGVIENESLSDVVGTYL
jgi:hypothetical protein